MPRAKSRLTKSATRQIAADLANCKRGQKTELIKRAAKLYGMHPATLRKHLKDAGILTSGTSRKRDAKRPEYRDWTTVLMMLSTKVPGDTIPLVDCLEDAIAADLLPPEAANVHISEYYRLAKSLGYRDTIKRTQVIGADYAWQAVQFDASTSKHLTVVKALDDGDYLLRLWHNPFPASGYKNKPLGPERLRLNVYAIWDIYSGAQLARYTVAMGENAIDSMDFLCWTMEEKNDPRIPFSGVYDHLWVDQGNLVKRRETRDLIHRLGPEIVTGEAYQKERMGGVEQTHARRWKSFEARFFMYCIKKGQYEITLSELNDRLYTHLERRINSRPARFKPGLSRTNAWLQSVNQRGGLRQLPPDPMETLATEAPRTLDQSGRLRWNNEYFEVKEIHSRKVIATRSLQDDQHVIVEDITTGEKYHAHPWTPPAYDDIKNQKTPTGAKIREQGGEISLATPDLPESDSKVVRLPSRTQPADPLHNPLDAGHYPDIQTAMLAFIGIYATRLIPAEREMVEQIIIQKELSKDAVKELALTMRGIHHQPESQELWP